MKAFIKKLWRKRLSHEPLIVMEISKERLLHNINEFKTLTPNPIAPVIKSNAYGHGLVEIASILEKEDVPFLVVDSHFEASALRSVEIKKPLLVIGYVRPEVIANSRLKNVSFTITSLETLETLCVNKKRKIFTHLKIDTGMNRQGITIEEIPETIKIFKNNDCLILEGVASHLCDADNENTDFTEQQIKKWNSVVETFKNIFPNIKYVHLSATHGHRFSTKINSNVSRLGIGMYGLEDGDMFNPPIILKPIMNMKTIITSIKRLRIGQSVGYNNTFKAKQDMTIATISAGYFEGIDQRLSNVGFVLVGPDRIPCKIVGKVSMNITCLDVSSVPDTKIGMTVIVVSNEPKDPNSISSMAKLCDTNTYGITVRFPAHLKRTITK